MERSCCFMHSYPLTAGRGRSKLGTQMTATWPALLLCTAHVHVTVRIPAILSSSAT